MNSYAEKCAHNLSAIDKKYFVEHTKFKDVQWNNKVKEATATINGDEQVKVKYTGCEHFGVAATLTMKNSVEPNKFNWKEKTKWLGSQILTSGDYDLLLKTLEANDINKESAKASKDNPYFLSINGSNHIEFIITIINSKDSKEIELSWYD